MDPRFPCIYHCFSAAFNCGPLRSFLNPSPSCAPPHYFTEMAFMEVTGGFCFAKIKLKFFSHSILQLHLTDAATKDHLLGTLPSGFLRPLPLLSPLSSSCVSSIRYLVVPSPLLFPGNPLWPHSLGNHLSALTPRPGASSWGAPDDSTESPAWVAASPHCLRHSCCFSWPPASCSPLSLPSEPLTA